MEVPQTQGCRVVHVRSFNPLLFEDQGCLVIRANFCIIQNELRILAAFEIGRTVGSLRRPRPVILAVACLYTVNGFSSVNPIYSHCWNAELVAVRACFCPSGDELLGYCRASVIRCTDQSLKPVSRATFLMEALELRWTRFFIELEWLAVFTVRFLPSCHYLNRLTAFEATISWTPSKPAKSQWRSVWRCTS